MGAKETLLALSRGFGLADDVSLSELRSSTWLARLKKSHKVRLLSRSRTIGVVVEPEIWAGLESLVEDLLEDVALGEQWAERLGHGRRPATVAAPELLQKLRQDDDAHPVP